MAKILVADDNSNIQKMVGLALKDQGIDVVAVGNGEAAVRKISDIKPDLVLADVFMPVRNGYEVCRYVKEDPSLSHIPVILLVGAFDPLDEQEAQRVGADGVLKKPFVPPDPLISMVKSALLRAGVHVGPEPPVEKVPEAPVRSTKELLTPGMGSKLAAFSPAALPEVAAEPVPEEFTTPGHVPGLKIAAGSEPLAFGSLLETPEEDLAFTSKPIQELEDEKAWGATESDDVAEEEEEEGPSRGWRPGAIEEDPLEEIATPGRGAKGKDWREEAFHGNSPANISSTRRWAPAETTQVAQLAEAPAVGVSTLEPKPAEAAAPFAGDAWAAALATNVEDKIADVNEAPAVGDVSAVASAPAAESRQEEDEVKAGEPANWASVTETPWEMEAKKASMLAATWDMPTGTSSVISAAAQFLAEDPAAESSEAAPAAEESAPAAADYVQTAQPVVVEERVAEVAPEVKSEQETPEPVFYAAEPVGVHDTQEIPAQASAEVDASSPYVASPLVEEAVEEVMAATPAEVKPAVHQSDMDELVARVLAKMSPDVLQKVTREILKPVIEAIIKDELDSKK